MSDIIRQIWSADLMLLKAKRKVSISLTICFEYLIQNSNTTNFKIETNEHIKKDGFNNEKLVLL